MQNNQNEFLNLKQAAATAGVNRMTIWRAVMKGVIEHFEQPGPSQKGTKPTIWVRRQSLLDWISSRPVTPVQTVTEQLGHVTEQLAHLEQQQSSVTAEIALQVINKALDRAGQAEQHLERALARAELAERQREVLNLELQSYKRVLSEQAESLAEERAYRLALEQQKLKVDTSRQSSGWANRWRRLLGLKQGAK